MYDCSIIILLALEQTIIHQHISSWYVTYSNDSKSGREINERKHILAHIEPFASITLGHVLQLTTPGDINILAFISY
jgi:hypothetical protein